MQNSIFDGRDSVYKKLGSSRCINTEESKIEKRSEIVGRLLTNFRLKRGYTQQEISDTIGIARQTYAGYEAGRHEPNIEILIRLSDIYEVSLDLLTGRYITTDLNFIYDAVIHEQAEESIKDATDKEKELYYQEQEKKPQRKKYNRAKKK